MAETEVKHRKILVAVCEGEESMYALSWCLNNFISRDSQDALILLYAKPPRVVYSALDGIGNLFSGDVIAAMERYSNEVAEGVIGKAKKLCQVVHRDIKVETKIEIGDPRDAICQMVESLGVDVLVMGSHGYGPIKRAFLGSVSNHCVQNVRCPVLIVKRPISTNGDS
ncbi:UspA [Dillenia turbinata]|uniref:UspA n=1 Tax=Dillenia turbinata TaxID=194707 RepID=A0AAN8YQP5_9MAGN